MLQRLLEGFVLRLARSRDAEAFALRGGMLVRSWTGPRRVADVDLVCQSPPRRRDLRAVLAERLDDGVRFDVDRIRIDGSPPNLTLFATGEVDGCVADMSVDIASGVDIWPRATREVVELSGRVAQLWVCPPEMLIGTKLRVLAELGPRAWRPKDLGDVWAMLRRFAAGPRLGEAFERTRVPRSVLAAPWLREPHARARWHAHHHAVELDTVLDAVGDALAPLGFAR